MKGNRIRELRIKKGMTQRELAKIVGTSQQQIQRIEANIQAARFDLAASLCKALNAPMENVFPQTKTALQRWRKRGAKTEEIYTDEKFTDNMQKADIDMDPMLNYFNYRLRGGAEGTLAISSIERDRLWTAVQRVYTDSTPFIVFDSDGCRVLLNLDHLILCQFLYEVPVMVANLDNEQSTEEPLAIELFLAQKETSIRYMAEQDEFNSSGDEEDDGELKNLLFMAETFVENNEVFHFTDGDGGETVFVRANDIAMMKIPLWAVEPSMQDEDDA